MLYVYRMVRFIVSIMLILMAHQSFGSHSSNTVNDIDYSNITTNEDPDGIGGGNHVGG
jgi:hypothetical protein